MWKAEQNEAAEKQKLAELQREITEERGREELRRIGQASGVLGGGKDDNHKLEWMYRGPKENLNREDYLLGRTVDKTFEQFAEEERATEKQEHLGVSVPKNHVEYECVPFSIRAYKDADPTSVQVDMARKIAEDPLMMIKQREMESRKRLLENPVKLKELKQLLQSESKKKKGGKSEGKKSKKSKKDKKSKKKRKKRESSSSSSSGSGDDSDVDDALLAMLSKQRAMAEDEVDMEDLNFEEMVTLKYDTLNKELDKMIGGDEKMKGGKNNHNNVRQRADSDHSESDERSDRRRRPVRDRDDRRGGRRVDRSRSRERQNRDKRSANYQRDVDRQPRRDRDRRRSRTRSPDERRRGRDREVRNRSRDRGESASVRNNHNRPKRRSPSVEKSKRRRADCPSPKMRTPEKEAPPRVTNREKSCEKQQRANDDSDEDRSRRVAANRNYGLVTASGESIALKNAVKSYTDRKAMEPTKDTKKIDWKKTSSQSSSRPKLSDAEKAERLREMTKNAEARDKERESYVRNYRKADRKEEERHRDEEFDRNFIHKELHKSAQSETVESRLKSNRNNIQRSSGAMDTNFAKR